jgi:hypothetical protein
VILVKQYGLTDQVDWSKAQVVAAEQAGVAEEVSRKGTTDSKQALK